MVATGQSDLAAFGHLKKWTSSSRSSQEEVSKVKLEPVDKAAPLTFAAVKTDTSATKTEAPTAKTEAPAIKTETPAGDDMLSTPAVAGKMREGRSALRFGNVARR